MLAYKAASSLTNWLKTTGQNAISQQLHKIFTPKFYDSYEKDLAAIPKFLKIIWRFLQSNGLRLFKYFIGLPYF